MRCGLRLPGAHQSLKSYYGDQTHCKNLDCVDQLEIGQAGYLLILPRIVILGPINNLVN